MICRVGNHKDQLTSAFFEACQHGKIDSIDFVANYNTSLLHQTKDGSTSIKTAIKQNETPIIQWLLTHMN